MAAFMYLPPAEFAAPILDQDADGAHEGLGTFLRWIVADALHVPALVWPREVRIWLVRRAERTDTVVHAMDGDGRDADGWLLGELRFDGLERGIARRVAVAVAVGLDDD